MNIHPEYQYLNLIKHIVKNGDKVVGRNGAVLSHFGTQMRFPLTQWRENKKIDIIPFLTTKKLAWKTCSKELFWFIRGETNNELLREQNVHIWDGNSTREFLDSRGLDYPEHILGPVYGWQWRNFNGKYPIPHIRYENIHSKEEKNCLLEEENVVTKYMKRSINNMFEEQDENGEGRIDQLQYVIDALKNDGSDKTKENKYSRRLIVSAWNPQQLNQMALPPCHIMFQFRVNSKDELSCSMYQRSGDVGLGVPFNIASYSLLTHIIAKHCDLKPGEFVYTIGDAHIYEEHVEALQEEIKRTPYDFPEIEILNKHDNINHYSLNDIKITNYQFHPSIKMVMKA